MISPTKALYIKLGQQGEWEKECLTEKQILKIGYREALHGDCLAGNWSEVENQLGAVRTDKGTITRDLNQIRNFYMAREDVLWITFHGNLLWWCFSSRNVELTEDKNKIRHVINRWCNQDIQGKQLSMEKLRGNLGAVQGYRGTICQVKEFQYVVAKINAHPLGDVQEAETAYQSLGEKIEVLITKLGPKDFELLVDLIFRQAGWKRLGEVGGTQKTKDIELWSPVANEKALVQVKSKANLQEYEEYRKRFAENEGFARFFFVVHTPEGGLQKQLEEKPVSKSGDEQLWGPRWIAKLCVEYGLSDWVIGKSG